MLLETVTKVNQDLQNYLTKPPEDRSVRLLRSVITLRASRNTNSSTWSTEKYSSLLLIATTMVFLTTFNATLLPPCQSCHLRFEVGQLSCLRGHCVLQALHEVGELSWRRQDDRVWKFGTRDLQIPVCTQPSRKELWKVTLAASFPLSPPLHPCDHP